MSKVFLVLHVHEAEDGSEEDWKVVGVFSAREKAEGAVSRLRAKPGFREHPEDFSISEYELDEMEWQEGFISWKDASE